MLRQCFTLMGCWMALTAFGQSDTLQRFTPRQLQQDFDSLYTILQDNHPALFAYYPKEKADKQFHAIKAQLTKPMTAPEFSRLAATFTASFRDGHTYVASADFEDPHFTAYVKNGGLLFPLGVAILEGKAYCAVEPAEAGSIQRGDEILSLNGLPVDSIVGTLSRSFPGDDHRTAVLGVQRLFGFLLWYQWGWGNRVQVEYSHNGTRKSEVVNGIGLEDYFAVAFGKGPVHQLTLYPEYSLAVVAINNYNSVKRSRAFIDSCFAVIKEKNIRHVALDLRRNGGGNSAVGTYFLAHLSRSPLTTVSAKTLRDGPLMQTVPTDNWRYAMLTEARTSWKKTGADLYTATFSSGAPDSLYNPNLFVDAQLYLLTSGATYSSAHMTALSVRCGKLGTIIGQPTGERLDLTGEVYYFRLPHTQTGVVTATASYKAACGTGSQVGVAPDYYVPIRLEDIREGRDAALEVLKELVRKKELQ